MRKLNHLLMLVLLVLCTALTACVPESALEAPDVSLDNLPAYAVEPYVVVNGNQPYFEESDLTTASYESYSELDAWNRCGVTMACISTDLMPTEERGSIGQVKPTGWQTVKYDCVDGKYLYNRCHLIGYQLTGENANKQNLITGTRYLNVEGMLPFENLVADYIQETENHVLYRVTPLFEGEELVARGVLMEALSVEDDGEGVCFNVYCYNVQPGVTIDYATGDSWLEGSTSSSGTDTAVVEYVVNTDSGKFHLATCSSAQTLSDENKLVYTGSRDDLVAQGYTPCGRCKP